MTQLSYDPLVAAKMAVYATVAASALVVGGVVLGVIASQPSGPPPLGDPATWGTGLQCSPGKSLADGFYPLENGSYSLTEPVRVLVAVRCF